jgi:hypothetical protein
MSVRPVRIAPGETLLWDDRFKIRFDGVGGERLDVLPLGEAKDRKEVKKPKDLPDFVFLTLPALSRKGRVLLVPQIGYSRPGSSGLRAEVLPASDTS